MKILLEIKALDLTQINIEIQFTREIQPESNLKSLLISFVRVCLNGANMFTLSG